MSEHSRPVSVRAGAAKTRLCLKCSKPFKSAWLGERICGHCKNHDSWRDNASSMSEHVMSRGR